MTSDANRQRTPRGGSEERAHFLSTHAPEAEEAEAQAPEPEPESQENDLESPEADVVEQRLGVGENDKGWWRRASSLAGGEVSEADAVEQSREVELDEDDYR
ncbi:hypothetical protein [Salinactinospora qingdaonensis]|uniref:Uncharacterized protein n=1 Tax=Salinactinospora qingdaonensis TaxID=702744 RepID=A0ABP7FIY7_9ACTN